MTVSTLQYASLLAKTAAFTALNYSETLNSIASRITGGRISHNTIAESILQQATTIALDIAEKNNDIGNYAQSFFGMDAHQFIDNAKVVLLSDDEKAFTQSVENLISGSLVKPEEEGVIPSEIRESVPKFAADLVNNYVGQKSVHQLLGAYAKNHDWNTITQSIQAQVSDGSDSYVNRLTLAGVRMGSNLVHSIVNRGIVETMPAGQEIKPELKLAAGCIDAYLSNTGISKKVLNEYQPTHALLNDDFLKTVADLGVAYANHLTKPAIAALANADAEYRIAQALHPFDTKVLDAAQSLVDSTKTTALESLKLAAQAQALKDILVSDTSSKNDDTRLADALETLLKTSIPTLPTSLQFKAIDNLKNNLLSGFIKPIANELSAGNGLPVQNIVGTFVARYGWNALENIILNSLEKHFSALDDIYSDDISVPKLATKLAIAHLEPYFENGRFDKNEHPIYAGIATFIHDDKEITDGKLTIEGLGNGLITYLNGKANNSAGYPASALYAGANTVATLQTWGMQAKEQGIANALEKNGYTMSAAAVSSVQALGAQVMEQGLVSALQSNAVSIGTNTMSYVSTATADFFATAQGLASRLLPQPASVPVELIA
jgi:hypothetical protein